MWAAFAEAKENLFPVVWQLWEATKRGNLCNCRLLTSLAGTPGSPAGMAGSVVPILSWILDILTSLDPPSLISGRPLCTYLLSLLYFFGRGPDLSWDACSWNLSPRTKDSEDLGLLPFLPLPQWPSAAPTCHKSTLTIESLRAAPQGSGTNCFSYVPGIVLDIVTYATWFSHQSPGLSMLQMGKVRLKIGRSQNSKKWR